MRDMGLGFRVYEIDEFRVQGSRKGARNPILGDFGL